MVEASSATAVIDFPATRAKVSPVGDTFTAAKFAWLDRIADDARVSPSAFKLAYVLATRFLNRQTGDAWPTQQKLAALTNVSIRHLQRLTDELVSAGHLEVTVARHRYRANRYRPIIQTGHTCPPSHRTSLSDDAGHTCPPTSFEENPLKRERERENGCFAREAAGGRSGAQKSKDAHS
jgi:hypothetical protein